MAGTTVGIRVFFLQKSWVVTSFCLAVGSLVSTTGFLLRGIELTPADFDDLVSFVRDGLLDERIEPENLCKLVPAQVPSGLPVLKFEACH